MTITAQTHEEKEEKKEKAQNERYHTSEFRYGKYVRTISFDQPVKIDDAKAKYKDGILTITIPKQQIETNTKKVIKINDED